MNEPKPGQDEPKTVNTEILRGYNDIMILFLLLDEPSYGYEISRRIREMTADRYLIKETTLYSAFTRLESSGFIEAFSGTVTMGRPRTYYRITADGREQYKAKCSEWQEIRAIMQPFIQEV